MRRSTIHFTGQVQGVGFRFTVQQIAATTDLTGYVRNLPDGRVELVVEGDEYEILSLLREIQDHMGGFIKQTDQQTALGTGEFAGFVVKH
jgi:acylphosphatase